MKPKKVLFQKKSSVIFNLNHLPSPLYASEPLPIKSAKASDLRKLAKDYIPGMYVNIPTADHDE